MPGERRHNLPAHPIRLIGRDEEVLAVRERLLDAERGLLTLTGAGGCGKTSLALDVARGLVDEFPDGVWLVELAALADGSLVPQAVAAPFGVLEGPERPLLDGLIAHLGPRAALLVLDNCEHLVDAAAALADALLSACPALRILATSREPLRVVGEVSWRVPSLAVPDPHQHIPPERLAGYAALQLFAERARAAKPGFALTPLNSPAVAQVCARLDGLPLAIELAAARVAVLAVEQIAARLDDSVRLLTSGSRTAASRQQTLQATLDWSHALLTDPEQALFRRLAAFAGGWDLEAAEAVCAGDRVGRDDVLELLGRLVDKSLVLEEEQGGAARYRLLEPVRQYARQRLGRSGEPGATQRRHAAHFLELAERAESGVLGREQAAWLGRLAREHDNLRAALRWAGERGEAGPGLRLGAALFIFWMAYGYLGECRRWLEPLLDAGPGGVEPAVRAKALAVAGLMAAHQGDPERAVSATRESVALSRASGDRRGLAFSLYALGSALGYRGEYEAAGPHFRECLLLVRGLGDRWWIAGSLVNEGDMVRNAGDREAARALLEEGASLFREAGDRWGRAVALALLGYIALEGGAVDRAAALAAEGVSLLREAGVRWKLAECLEVLAGVAGARKQAERAARLFGAAEALREVMGAPRVSADVPAFTQGVAAARAAWDETAFSTTWAEGRRLSSEQAIAEALASEAATSASPRVAPEATAPPVLAGLTPREREAAALVARGLSNRQIAEQMVISERTAEGHVSNVLGKLGLASRAQLAAWGTQRGLSVPPQA
jgi:non-specific serine/threonine protein kinase